MDKIFMAAFCEGNLQIYIRSSSVANSFHPLLKQALVTSKIETYIVKRQPILLKNGNICYRLNSCVV